MLQAYPSFIELVDVILQKLRTKGLTQFQVCLWCISKSPLVRDDSELFQVVKEWKRSEQWLSGLGKKMV